MSKVDWTALHNKIESMLIPEVEEDLELLFSSEPSRQWCVAGGFVRDHLLGKPIADIDVVVTDSGAWDYDWTRYMEGDFAYDHGGVRGVANTGETFMGYPIQLIERDGAADPDTIRHYHTTGLSNAFFYNGVVSTDDRFKQCVQDQTIYVRQGRFPGENLMKYVNKIRAKFPEYKVVYEGNEHE